MGEEITVCVFCEKRIWKDTHGWRHERSGSMPICNSTPEPKTTITCPQCEGVPEMCNGYCEGTGKVTTNSAAEWNRQNDEPKAGKTLADFAGSDKAFKRPHHALAYGFITVGGFLKEFDPNGDGPITLARLTAEDLKADDWQEVHFAVDCGEKPDFGPNNTTNTGEDGLLPALS